MKAQVVVGGIAFGEGPVWCPADETLVVTSVSHGVLHRVWPNEQRQAVLARTGGGPNATALATDGSVVVTQNGGVDHRKFAADWPEPEYVPSGLQLVSPAGRVESLCAGSFQNPNDLVISAKGTVYFTDPKSQREPGEYLSRVMSYDLDGNVKVVADRFHFCNGIAIGLDGNLVVVENENNSLIRVFSDGSREPIIENLDGADGFCLDQEGRYYVSSPAGQAINIVEDGRVVERLEVGGMSLNCCFGGKDNLCLFATNATTGELVVFENMPVPGLPLHMWPIESATPVRD